MKILFGFFVVLITSLIAFFLTKFNLSSNNLPVITSKNEIIAAPSPFSLKTAPSETLRGKLNILANGVLWQDRIATQSSQIMENIIIQQGEKVETDESGRAEILFENMVSLKVYSGSSLSIIQTLPIDLVFALNIGKAEVDNIGTNTVSIRSKHLLTKVNGTLILEMDEVKPIIRLQVIKGSARLAFNNLKFETQSYDMHDGETVEFNDSTRKVVVR